MGDEMAHVAEVALIITSNFHKYMDHEFRSKLHAHVHGVSKVSGKNGGFLRCMPEWVQVTVELVRARP